MVVVVGISFNLIIIRVDKRAHSNIDPSLSVVGGCGGVGRASTNGHPLHFNHAHDMSQGGVEVIITRVIEDDSGDSDVKRNIDGLMEEPSTEKPDMDWSRYV